MREGSTTLLSAAIVLAALLIALALYFRPVPNRYSFEAGETEVRRFDTANGKVTICAANEKACSTFDWEK